MTSPGATTALLRFHLATGVRLALRAFVPVAGAAVVAVGMQQYPAATLAFMARSLGGAPFDPRGWLLVTGAALAVAIWATPRATLGSRGWMMHLPASRPARSVALVLAVAAAELPVLIAAEVLAVGGAATWPGCGWIAIPAAPLVGLATSAAAVLLSRARRNVRHPGVRPSPLDLAPFELRVAVRALGSTIVSAWIAGLLPLAAALQFVRNNQLPEELKRRAVVFGAGLSVTLAISVLADALAVKRPSWPWARSLPETSHARVGADAAFLAGHTVPLLALSALLDVRAALAAGLGATPLLALRAAAALRRGGGRRTPASAPVLAQGAAIASILALQPWMLVIGLALLAPAFQDAARRDRLQKVTRWSALHHQAAGDTTSWTV